MMQAGIDAPNVFGESPQPAFNTAVAIYFVAFVVFGAFFSSDLFIGVLVTSFSESNGSALLKEGQKQWVHRLVHRLIQLKIV